MKTWIVFYADDGSGKSCNTYYCWVVQASSKKAAINKVRKQRPQTGTEDLEAKQKCVIK